jgi:hypothetical protein
MTPHEVQTTAIASMVREQAWQYLVGRSGR